MGRPAKRPRISGRGRDPIHLREVGDLSPRSFAHRIAASEDLVLCLGIHKKLNKHQGCVNSVTFNAEGNIIVTGSDDRMIMLWDWDAGYVKHEFLSGHTRNVLHAQIMPFRDDTAIITCAADGEVRHAEILEGGKTVTTLLGKHEGRAHKVAVEPGSPYVLYSCGEDGLLQHYDLRTKSATELFVCKSFEDKKDYMPIIHLYSIAIDPRNPYLLALAGSEEYARIYDIRKYRLDGSTNLGQPVDCFCPTHLIGDRQVGITGLAFSNQSELLASYNDESIYLFSNDQGLGPSPFGRYLGYPLHGITDDTSTGSEPQAYRGHCNRDTLKGVSFFGPNCEYVASGSDCGRIFLWKTSGGRLLQVMAGDQCVVNCIAAHPYATMLASSGIDPDVKIWTPNAAEPAPSVDTDKFLLPGRLDYCVIAQYEEDEDREEIGHDSENECDTDN